MEFAGLKKFFEEQIALTGKGNTYERFKSMLTYAENCLNEAPREKCADALDYARHVVKVIEADLKTMCS